MFLVSSLAANRKKLVQIAVFSSIILLALALGTQNLSRSKVASPAVEATREELTAYRPQADKSYSRLALPASGVVRGITGGLPVSAGVAEPQQGEQRKVIRTGTLALIVLHPAEQVERITQIAHQHGGYVVQSQVTGQREQEAGSIVIRVPAAQFDLVRNELKRLAKSVEQESTTADDVTMRLAENEATLRNYRAEESSYLEIMKRSGKISDTLEVARELADVRGRIERLAAEIRTMNLQTEMTAINVNLRAEPVVASGNSWRPLLEFKLAWKDGLEALADYATIMMAFVLRLPAVLAWALTLFVSLKIAIKLLKKIAQSFGIRRPAPVAQ